MIYNFRLAVAIRVVLLSVFITAIVYCFFKTSYVIVPFILFTAIVATVCELILYLEKSNREFANFLASIKSSDFAKQNSLDKRGRSFSRLKQAQNLIVEKFQSVRINNEAHYFFLRTVVEHIQTAIISFDKKGEIILVNEAAKDLLHIPDLRNIFSLQAADPILCNYLMTLKPGNNPALELKSNGEKLKLSMRATHFLIQGNEHKLISIQNIKSEVESAELLAWEQLIHVLTHEIMNSMTPISSLSSLLKSKADQLEIRKQDSDIISDLTQGLEVIERRSRGLMSFVDNYKKINTLPEPEFRDVSLNELFGRIKLLKQEELTGKTIVLKLHITNPQLTIRMDAGLIEQTLINLINNAADALEDRSDASIILSAEKKGDILLITVQDNGAGIPEENFAKIFIPFFSTKKTGSGIGLSLSKQIMRLHKGTISLSSIPGERTIFTLEFPAA